MENLALNDYCVGDIIFNKDGDNVNITVETETFSYISLDRTNIEKLKKYLQHNFPS